MTAGASAQLQPPHIEGRCGLVVHSDLRIESTADAQYYGSLGYAESRLMDGVHQIKTSGAVVVSKLSWGVTTGYYFGTRTGVAAYSTCYRASNQATRIRRIGRMT